MSSTEKPLVLIFGATGRSAKPLIRGLIDSGAFRLAAISRNATHPQIVGFAAEGVDVRVVDVGSASPSELERALAGVDVIVSVAGAPGGLQAQRPLFAAAKAAGVKRIVPSDFGTVCPPGVRALQDEKIAIHEYIKSLGLHLTSIEIGWWFSLAFPYPSDFVGSPLINEQYKFFGDGSTPIILTSLDQLGLIVSRIIQDERTLDRAVFVCGQETTQREIWDLATEIGFNGDRKALEDKTVHVPIEDLVQQAEAAKAAYAKEQKYETMLALHWTGYLRSAHADGHNSVQFGKKLGMLDFRELYPDVKLTTLREGLEEFYRAPPDFPY